MPAVHPLSGTSTPWRRTRPISTPTSPRKQVVAAPSLFELPARPFTARSLPYDLHSSLHSPRAAPVDALASLDHSMRKALYAFGRRPATASTHRPASAREISAGSGARAAARLCELWPQAKAPPAAPRDTAAAAKGGPATPSAAPSAAPPSDNAPAGAYDDLQGGALVRARLEEITGRPRNRMWEQIMQGWKAKSLMQALRAHIGPLHNLDDSEVAVLLGHSQLHTLKRYAELWRKATPMDSFYVLIRGALRRTTRTGTRQPVGVGAPLAGGAWLREPVYHIDSVLATEASIVLQINVRAVQSDTKLARGAGDCVAREEAEGRERAAGTRGACQLRGRPDQQRWRRLFAPRWACGRPGCRACHAYGSARSRTAVGPPHGRARWCGRLGRAGRGARGASCDGGARIHRHLLRRGEAQRGRLAHVALTYSVGCQRRPAARRWRGGRCSAARAVPQRAVERQSASSFVVDNHVSYGQCPAARHRHDERPPATGRLRSAARRAPAARPARE